LPPGEQTPFGLPGVLLLLQLVTVLLQRKLDLFFKACSLFMELDAAKKIRKTITVRNIRIKIKYLFMIYPKVNV